MKNLNQIETDYLTRVYQNESQFIGIIFRLIREYTLLKDKGALTLKDYVLNQVLEKNLTEEHKQKQTEQRNEKSFYAKLIINAGR